MYVDLIRIHKRPCEGAGYRADITRFTQAACPICQRLFYASKKQQKARFVVIPAHERTDWRKDPDGYLHELQLKHPLANPYGDQEL